MDKLSPSITRDPNGCYSNFWNHVNHKSLRGQDCYGTPKDYIPSLELHIYWTSDRIAELFAATLGRDDVSYEAIRQGYIRILSIIVWMAEKGKPNYLSFLQPILMKREIDDHSLPICVKPPRLPNNPDVDNFFEAFMKHQWRFCPIKLGFATLFNKEIDPRSILPFSATEERPETCDETLGKEATVKFVKVHSAAEGLPTTKWSGEAVLKCYPLTARESFKSELQLYTAIHNAENKSNNILQCHGTYHFPTKDGKSAILVLERADRSLLDEYRRDKPPQTPEDIHAFWKSLTTVILGLEKLHAEFSAVFNSTVHQDIKPSNIFLFKTRPDSNAFDFNAKLGDFGLSHTRISGPETLYPFGYSNGSPRTYSPPELHLGDDVTYRVEPSADMWSIACVFIEAAMWVVYGERGRVNFMESRKNETGASRQGSKGHADCFHNGVDPLHAVKNVIEFVGRDGRRCDHVTQEIARQALEDILSKEPRERLLARQLHARLDKILRYPRLTSLGSYGYSLHPGDSYLSSGSVTSPGLESRYSSGSGTPRSPIYSPSLDDTVTDLRVSSSHRSSYGSGPPETGFATEPARLLDRSRLSSRTVQPIQPSFSPMMLETASTSASSAEIHEESQQPAILGISQHPRQTRQKQSVCGPVIDEQLGDPRPNERQPLRPGLNEETRQSDESGHYFPQPTLNIAGEPPENQATSSRPPINTSHLSGKTTSGAQGLPHLTIQEVEDWRKLKKQFPKSYRPLKGKDRAFPLLRKRDHIFLVDNSETMQSNKDHMDKLVRNLAYLLKEADENGLDVMLTSENKMKSSTKSSELSDYVLQSFHKGAEKPCLIEQSLDYLVSEVIKKLPKQGARSTSVFSYMKERNSKPVSIYVLTNGIWDQNARSGVCRTDVAINRLIKTIEERNLPLTQVVFQFIRLGDDALGKRRLEQLDNNVFNSMYRDIIDHKSSTDNVWHMLIGALDDNIDNPQNDNS